ncbi:MAG TPA: hypothetical protein VMZ53_08660 [Kofleriaceae bacterium]|nr:hypothetical protein [Kofleriaceae bacterium]
MRVAIAISAAVHVALFVWLEQAEPPAPVRPPAPSPVTIEVLDQVTPPEPMTVALLDDHSVVTTPPDATPASHTPPAPGKHRRAGLAVSVSSTTGSTTGTTETTAPAHSSLMTMRHPEKETLQGPTGSFVDRFLQNTKPLTDPDAKYGVISRHLRTGAWIDGATSDEVLAARMEQVAMNDARANAELKPNGTGTKTEHTTFKMKFNADGTVKEIKDKANWQQKSLFFAEFDVTDAMMRKQGIDPYSSYKKKVLDETREQRFEMGSKYRTQQLAQSRHFMQRNLERLLASTTDKAQIKEGLFELWDDCAEAGSEELVAGGTAARQQLIGYIHAHLPRDSADAFTSDEIAMLNKKRKSRSEFAPY